MVGTGFAKGFSVLDGAALVLGGATASVHLLRVDREGLGPAGWSMIWFAFALVGLTAAGPFVYLARRHWIRQQDYPAIGDRLWALLGVPWVATAILRSALLPQGAGESPLFMTSLSLGLVFACATAGLVVWSTWVAVPPEQAAVVETGNWTSRLGLVLSIAWPIQFGLGLVVLG